MECSKLGKTWIIEDAKRGMVRNTGFCGQNCRRLFYPELPVICFPPISRIPLFLILMEEAADQTVVVLWSHKAEPDVFIIQKRKRRTVADHHFLPDGAVKQILRGEIFAQNAHQNKVGTWIVYFEVRILVKKLTQAGALGRDDAKEDVIAKAKESIADKLTGNIVKEIYVPGRIVNIVMK